MPNGQYGDPGHAGEDYWKAEEGEKMPHQMKMKRCRDMAKEIKGKCTNITIGEIEALGERFKHLPDGVGSRVCETSIDKLADALCHGYPAAFRGDSSVSIYHILAAAAVVQLVACVVYLLVSRFMPTPYANAVEKLPDATKTALAAAKATSSKQRGALYAGGLLAGVMLVLVDARLYRPPH